MANEVFISYSRKDYDIVRPIKNEIDLEVGIESWMDLDGIESDEQFEDVIINAINQHDTLLFMMSQDSMHSKWALRELAFAERKHKRIVLIRIDKATMPDKFCFRYQEKDQIEWNNDLQRSKLLENLKEWFPIIEHDSFTHIFINNHRTVEQAEEFYRKAHDLPWVGNEIEKFKLLQIASELGSHAALFELGWCYEKGTGTKQNVNKAIRCYRKSAEEGFCPAQVYIAKYYEEGIIVSQDNIKAFRWYKKAAEQGYSPACYHLGICYEHGRGTSQDIFMAVEWYKLAAKDRMYREQANIALCRLSETSIY